MSDEEQLEAKRVEIITYYQGEGDRLEQQAVETFRLAGLCRSWAQGIRHLAPTGVEYVHGIVERAKSDQAERGAQRAMENAMAEATRELSRAGKTIIGN